MAFIIHKAMVEGQRSEGVSFGKGKRFQGHHVHFYIV